MLVYHRDEEIAAVVGRMTGSHITPPYTAIGVAYRGLIIGGFVFNNFTGPDIEMSVAGKHVISRGVLRAVARYTFGQLGVRRVSITMRATDKTTQDIAQRLGFTLEGFKHQAFWNDDAVLMGLTKDNCRWL